MQRDFQNTCTVLDALKPGTPSCCSDVDPSKRPSCELEGEMTVICRSSGVRRLSLRVARCCRAALLQQYGQLVADLGVCSEQKSC